MSTLAFNENYYREWCAYQNDDRQRLPLWARDEKIFNCESNNRSANIKKNRIFGLFRKANA